MCDNIFDFEIDDDFLEYIDSIPKVGEVILKNKVAESIDYNFEDTHTYEPTSIEREVVYNTLGDIHDNARIKWNITTNERAEEDLTQEITTLDSFLVGKGYDGMIDGIEMSLYRLNTFMDKLPHGIFDKQVTGIGATTIEINSSRNSIIVLPTKHLAYSKYKLHENTLYIGSQTKEIANALSHVETYLKNEKYPHKKFLVVADSLGMLIKEIQSANIYNNIYKEFFLMVDEIDLLQEDNNYRPSLEDVVDYYFRFNVKNRCLVSATIKEFSNPLFINECKFDLSRIEKQKREITLIETNNIAQQIVSFINSTPHEKILIAYNSIIEALVCIELLDDTIKKQCAMLCGESSKQDAGNYYDTLNEDGNLPKRITFMTSAYFVGIDINDDYHLVTITNSLVSHHTLSIAKIIQIHGRCREHNTILSDTIISQFKNSKSFSISNNLEHYRNHLINKVEKVLELYEALDKILTENLGLHNLFDRIKESIRKGATEILGHNETLQLTREDIEGNYVVAYFNIDYLVERFNLLNNVYISKEAFEESLKEHNIHIINYQQVMDASKDINQVEAEKAIKEKSRELSFKQLEDTIKSLNDLYIDDNLTIKKIEYHKRGADRDNKIFLDRVIRFYNYLDFHEIYPQLMAVHLKDIRHYRRLNNAVMFWALDDIHPFKLAVNKRFDIGREYLPKEISETINEIFKPF